MIQANDVLFNATTMGQTLHSGPINMEFKNLLSVQAVWTGTPVGNFTIETSDDPGQIDPLDGTVTGITNWSTYTSSTQAAGGAAGSFTWRIADFQDKWARLTYTFSSSTGSLSARFQSKGF